jgi:hypothetical protein
MGMYPGELKDTEKPTFVSTWNGAEKRPEGPFKPTGVISTSNPEVLALICETMDGEKVYLNHRTRDMTIVRKQFGVNTPVENWGWIDLEPILGTSKLRVVVAREQPIQEERIVE